MAASATSRATKTIRSIKACLRQRLGRYHALSPARLTRSFGLANGALVSFGNGTKSSTQPRHGLKFGNRPQETGLSLGGPEPGPDQLVGPTVWHPQLCSPWRLLFRQYGCGGMYTFGSAFWASEPDGLIPNIFMFGVAEDHDSNLSRQASKLKSRCPICIGWTRSRRILGHRR